MSNIFVPILSLGLMLTSTVSQAELSLAESDVIIVKSSPVGSAVLLGGKVTPEKIINLSAQMPGDVKFVAGSEGDAFKKGDALISLDTSSLQAKRAQAVSQLANAEAAHRNAIVQYNHELQNPNAQANAMLGGAPSLFSMFGDPMRSMMGQGDPDVERQSSLYGQRVQVETAFNGISQARAALRELDESLKNATSYAPFNGIILKKMVELGDIVQPGMPLVSFADTSQLQIRVEVPTRLLSGIKSNKKILSKLDGNDKLITISLDRIFPMTGAGGNTTTVKFNLPSGTKAHPGMYAEVMVPDAGRHVTASPMIPKSAIVWRGSLPAVYLVDKDSNQKLRLIRIEEQVLSDGVRVISGLSVGDTILANPLRKPRSSSSPNSKK